MITTTHLRCHCDTAPVTLAPGRRRGFVDTETMGFGGIPFLLQFRFEGESKVQVFHVFDYSPSEVACRVRSLFADGAVWVGHNLMFDLQMLSKLLTVAESVPDWSFESIWEAERLWRGDVSYRERLQHLFLIYPAAVEDTLIAAQSLPPLYEMFMRPTSVRFAKLPVAVVPQLERVVGNAIDRHPYYRSGPSNLSLGESLKSHIDGDCTKKGRQSIRAQQAREDFSDLRETRLTIKARSPYSLKNIASHLGFPGTAQRFEFLDDFGRIDDQPCPTYPDRELYRDLHEYTVERQHDPGFLDYARQDVEMVEFIHRHYSRQEGYANLAHNFEVLPLMANLRLYGVHVDPDRVAATRRIFADRVTESRELLQKAGLDNFNSSQKVVRFVNRLLKTTLTVDSLEELGPVDDMREETLDRVLSTLASRLGDDHPGTATMRHLLRARTSAKRLQFFEAVVGDTLYPSFHIKGTQTDRMTSSNPAIQTIPKPSVDEKEDGADFRAAFTPPEGYQMLVGDFSQFEMRLMAAEAREEHLIRAFVDQTDTHAVTALRTMESQIRRAAPEFASMPADELLQRLVVKDNRLKQFRERAKVLNFGIAYGATKYGVARLAGISTSEADELIGAFHAAYPALSKDIRKTQVYVSLLCEEMGLRGYSFVSLGRPKNTQVQNRVGITRRFDVPFRLIEILMKLAESDDICRYLPVLGRPTSALVRYYDEDKTPEQVVRSQLRSAARKMQGYVHRQAYNFRIQSLGAYYTKRLQTVLAAPFAKPGVHRAADLPMLPGINVHDEIHLYVTDCQDQILSIASTFTEDVSRDLGVPVKFDFVGVGSWAEKG